MSTRSVDEILTDLIGQVITVINPQCYKPTLTGYKIDAEAYKAKVVSCDNGILQLLTDYLCNPHKKIREKAYQFIPVDQIKRIMISKSERLLNL